MRAERTTAKTPSRSRLARRRRAAAPMSLRVPQALRERLDRYADAMELEEATAARVLIAERLSQFELGQEMALAEEWQLSQVQGPWSALRRGRLELAAPGALKDIFRTARKKARRSA